MPVFLVFISNSPHQAVNLILPRIAAHCLEESVFVVLSHPLVHFLLLLLEYWKFQLAQLKVSLQEISLRWWQPPAPLGPWSSSEEFERPTEAPRGDGVAEEDSAET